MTSFDSSAADFDPAKVTPTHFDKAGVNGAGRTLGQSWLPLFGVPSLSNAQIQQLSPSALAYLGDAVYELYVRGCYLMPPKRIQAYHQQVVSQVRAERQAEQVRSLLEHLTEAELTILKRGRNAATGKPKRIDLNTYRQATSLETLIGYLYLTDPQRLLALLNQLHVITL